MNTFYNTIVFVRDLKKSKEFYETVIGLKAEQDYGTIVFFENHFVLHDANNLKKTVFKRKSFLNFKNGKRNLEIYFESDNLEQSFDKVVKSGMKIIHGMEIQAWGQKVFRFFDPDGHIVEIGELMHLAQDEK